MPLVRVGGLASWVVMPASSCYFSNCSKCLLPESSLIILSCIGVHSSKNNYLNVEHIWIRFLFSMYFFPLSIYLLFTYISTTYFFFFLPTFVVKLKLSNWRHLEIQNFGNLAKLIKIYRWYFITLPTKNSTVTLTRQLIFLSNYICLGNQRDLSN